MVALMARSRTNTWRWSFAFIPFQHPILPKGIAFATDQAMDRVAPQTIMIIEVTIAQHQTIDALTKELLNAMFNIALVPVVDETAA